MVEMIDKDTNKKIMAMVLVGWDFKDIKVVKVFKEDRGL